MDISILKKADIALIVLLCIFALLFIFIFDFSKQEGGKVIVKIDGQVYKELPMGENTRFDVLSSDDKIMNTISIQNGKVRMVHADCPDGLCMRQGEICHTSETIVCLPNRVVVEVQDDENVYDAIVK